LYSFLRTKALRKAAQAHAHQFGVVSGLWRLTADVTRADGEYSYLPGAEMGKQQIATSSNRFRKSLLKSSVPPPALSVTREVLHTPFGRIWALIDR